MAQMGRADALARDSVARGFSDLKTLGDANGFRTLVVIFPNYRQLDPYPFRTEHAAVRSQAEKNGFLVLDLIEGCRKYVKRTGEKLDFDGIHPNAAGHRLAADLMAEFIEKSGLIESSASPGDH